MADRDDHSDSVVAKAIPVVSARNHQIHFHPSRLKILGNVPALPSMKWKTMMAR
jgi:hypothetical protein